MTYMQAALVLDAAPRRPPDDPPPVSSPRVGWAATRRHTSIPSGRWMPDDEWNEYRLECATRQRLQLPDVSLVEFADMRDWTDGVEKTDDDHEYHDYEYRNELDPLPPGCSPH